MVYFYILYYNNIKKKLIINMVYSYLYYNNIKYKNKKNYFKKKTI